MTRGRWFLIWLGSALFGAIWWFAFVPPKKTSGHAPDPRSESQRWMTYRRYGPDCCEGPMGGPRPPIPCAEVLRGLVELAAGPIDSEFGASARSEMTKCPAAVALANAPKDPDPATTHARSLTGTHLERNDAARALLADPATTANLIDRIKRHDYTICGENPGCPARDAWLDALVLFSISAELTNGQRETAKKTADQLR